MWLLFGKAVTLTCHNGPENYWEYLSQSRFCTYCFCILQEETRRSLVLSSSHFVPMSPEAVKRSFSPSRDRSIVSQCASRDRAAVSDSMSGGGPVWQAVVSGAPEAGLSLRQDRRQAPRRACSTFKRAAQPTEFPSRCENLSGMGAEPLHLLLLMAPLPARRANTDLKNRTRPHMSDFNW